MTGRQAAPERLEPPGLRRFRTPRPPASERCELCGAMLTERHRHLADTARRALACACTPCALLFDRPGAGQFRTVPDRYLTDPGHTLDASAWDLLQIPVGIAFFLRDTAQDRLVALYPSPAGATESELDPSVWQSVLGAGRLADLLEPDVEALLLRRSEDRIDCYLVPVDICYELIGRMRLLWQGFDGGAEARAALDDFFARVARRARPLKEDDRP